MLALTDPDDDVLDVAGAARLVKVGSDGDFRFDLVVTTVGPVHDRCMAARERE